MLVLREQVDPAPKKTDFTLEHLRAFNMIRGQELSVLREKARNVLGSSTRLFPKLSVELYITTFTTILRGNEARMLSLTILAKYHLRDAAPQKHDNLSKGIE